LQILKLLSTKGAQPYTEIMYSLKLDPVRDAGKFVYHLRSLSGTGLINLDKRAKKYEITDLGQMIVQFSRDLEEYVNVKRGKLYVRTSRFAIEEFHRSKIARSLAVEAGMPQEMADEIAAEAEDRLMRLKTGYLTSPLIREFVNAILIEKKLEEYRHKLTRLGLPVYDVSQLLRSTSDRGLTAESVRGSAGSSVISEYVLLECLPHEIADAHISGSIHIANLDSWILKPSEFFHDLRYFLKNGLPGVKPPDSFEDALAVAQAVYLNCTAEVSGEQIFDMFNVFMAPFVEDNTSEDLTELVDVFLTSIRRDLVSFIPGQGLSLGFEFYVPESVAGQDAIGPGGKTRGLYGDYQEEVSIILESMLESALKASLAKPLYNPRLIFKIRDKVLKNGELKERLTRIHELAASRSLPYFQALKDDMKTSFSATGLRLSDDWTGNWEADCLRTGSMDTVFLNLPRLAYESRKSEERFFTELRELVSLAIEAFKAKRKFIQDRLKQPLLPLLAGSGGQSYFYERNAAYNLAAIGLNEAIQYLTGNPIRRDKETLDFASRILTEISKQLKPAAEESQMRLALSQRPGDEASQRLAELDLERYGRSTVLAEGSKTQLFYTDLPTVPLTLKMPLSERIEVESRFQDLTGGGHFQPISLNANPSPSAEELFKLTTQIAGEGIRFFAYSTNYAYCKSCNRTETGTPAKCSSCGSDKLTQYARASSTYQPLELWPEGKRRALERRVEYSTA
jgi:ribonucleoside-triphosphate reductase